jgi:hypothetical protein
MQLFEIPSGQKDPHLPFPEPVDEINAPREHNALFLPDGSDKRLKHLAS